MLRFSRSPQSQKQMNYKYFPHTDSDLQAMLARAGVDSLEALYAEVPEAIRFRAEYLLNVF